MKERMAFPVLKFIGTQQMVVPIHYRGQLLADKNYMNHYFPTEINVVDSEGTLFRYQKVKAVGGLQWMPSIRYVGKLYALEPILLEAPSSIALDTFKSKVIDFAGKGYKKKGMSLEELKEIREAVQQAPNHQSIIKIIDQVSYWK